MSPAKENDAADGDDGIRARKSGTWARVKLSFLDDFIPPALQVVGKSKRPLSQRWYVDLFAGPGRNVDQRTGRNFEGSAVRALPRAAQSDSRIHFTHAALVNKDVLDHEALRERVRRLRDAGRCPVPAPNLHEINGDANAVLPEILRRIDPYAYALVVADITRPAHWPWSSAMALRAQGHHSIDFYMLFPLWTAINRMMPWKAEAVEPNAPALDRFFGTDGWRRLLPLRTTDAKSPEFRQAVLEFYTDRLKAVAGWKYAFPVRVASRKGVGLYQMIFATNSPVAAKLGEWSRQKKDHGEEEPRFL